MGNTSELLTYISQEVGQLDIAGYLKEEISSLCKYLHVYKLKNIWDNIEPLKEYLYFLDAHSTQQLQGLDYIEASYDVDPMAHDLSYYLSQEGIKTIGEAEFRQKLESNDGQLNGAMQAVKGFLLLTADEFCNATKTRMSISRRTWQKQENKN
ncbi:MAG: hypothetical protein WCO66_04190 [Candidatus Absconditabacteria bacterium]